MHYIMNVGDAWFAQVPREGNIYVRAANMHDTATRCTACHPSSFSTEANLVAHRNGYPIRSKSNFQYVIDRLYNSITPLYGDDGLYWQRFIAIPLQAQGKQGGILLDFEREVSRRADEDGRAVRAVPAAGLGIAQRPAAGRAQRRRPARQQVRLRLARLAGLSRAGRAEPAATTSPRPAANIAAILGERAADRRIENLQDRIHRLYAWWLIDKTKHSRTRSSARPAPCSPFRTPTAAGTRSIPGPGPSAVYTTGQLAWTLLRIGLPRDHPALAKALRYLLAQQQDFGGWFQTTTHENFRTPMRETRYAVMALAEAFPAARSPAARMGQPRRRPGALAAHRLAGAHARRSRKPLGRARAGPGSIRASDHPVARSRRAAGPRGGRGLPGPAGQAESAAPLVGRLDDPSKIVWRAAAWALRRLGNQGIGIDAIAAALEDPNPSDPPRGRPDLRLSVPRHGHAARRWPSR